MRVRSRWGVWGSFQSFGKSEARARMVWRWEGSSWVWSGASSFEVVESILLLGEPGVPVGFELRGDEAVVRVDAEEASAGEFGLLGGALGVALSERVGFVGAGGEFVLDAEGGFEAEGGDEFDEESADGLIDAGSGDGLTGRGGGFGAAAEVAGEALVAAGVVSDGHAAAAPATQDEPLEECGPLARGAWAAGAEGGVGLRKSSLVGFELLPGEEAGVGVEEQDLPVGAGQLAGGDPSVGEAAAAGAAEAESAGVAGVFEGAEDAGALEGLPEQLAAARPVLGAAGEEQVLVAEEAEHGAGGARTLVGIEQRLDRLPNLGVGVEHDAVLGVVDESDGERDPQLAAARPAPDAAAQPGAQQMEFGLTHGALEAEEEPVVEVGGVVDAVLVEDQGVGEGAQLEQPVPVGVVAGEPGDFETEDDAGGAHADFGDEAAEALPVGGGAGPAEVGVDDDDLAGRPAEGERPLAERVLAAGALLVLDHLAEGGLAHIQERGAAPVVGGDLGVEGAHAAASGRCARIMSRSTATAGAGTSGARGVRGRTTGHPGSRSRGVVSQAARPRSTRVAGPCRTPDAASACSRSRS